MAKKSASKKISTLEKMEEIREAGSLKDNGVARAGLRIVGVG